MGVISAASVGMVVLGVLTAAGNNAGSGPDFIGIAAVITAATGGFATVVMAILATIRYIRSGDPPSAEDIGAEIAKKLREGGQ